MSGILTGVRIADFTEYIAGPYCTMVLADLGADVLKIEPPGGDRMRYSAPLDGEGRGFLQVNRTKRSFVVDLKKEDAADIVRRVVESVDAVVVNQRPQATKRLGIDYETRSLPSTPAWSTARSPPTDTPAPTPTGGPSTWWRRPSAASSPTRARSPPMAWA